MTWAAPSVTSNVPGVLCVQPQCGRVSVRMSLCAYHVYSHLEGRKAKGGGVCEALQSPQSIILAGLGHVHASQLLQEGVGALVAWLWAGAPLTESRDRATVEAKSVTSCRVV